mmetsp:Transcript_21800/g.47530  ORF Transcript_21800/g.47530 Transcript_21800/m.47530 type:complete len:525 (-) Transcript_21800:186-1760(-)
MSTVSLSEHERCISELEEKHRNDIEVYRLRIELLLKARQDRQQGALTEEGHASAAGETDCGSCSGEEGCKCERNGGGQHRDGGDEGFGDVDPDEVVMVGHKGKQYNGPQHGLETEVNENSKLESITELSNRLDSAIKFREEQGRIIQRLEDENKGLQNMIKAQKPLDQDIQVYGSKSISKNKNDWDALQQVIEQEDLFTSVGEYLVTRIVRAGGYNIETRGLLSNLFTKHNVENQLQDCFSEVMRQVLKVENDTLKKEAIEKIMEHKRQSLVEAQRKHEEFIAMQIRDMGLESDSYVKRALKLDSSKAKPFEGFEAGDEYCTDDESSSDDEQIELSDDEEVHQPTGNTQVKTKLPGSGGKRKSNSQVYKCHKRLKNNSPSTCTAKRVLVRVELGEMVMVLGARKKNVYLGKVTDVFEKQDKVIVNWFGSPPNSFMNAKPDPSISIVDRSWKPGKIKKNRVIYTSEKRLGFRDYKSEVEISNILLSFPNLIQHVYLPKRIIPKLTALLLKLRLSTWSIKNKSCDK